MTHSLPERADFSHLREEAKALLRALQAGEPEALSLAREHDPSISVAEAKLADAQRIVARKYGFASWNRLKSAVETPQLITKFAEAVRHRRADELDRLLSEHAVLRKEIDGPHCDFDAPAIVICGDVKVAKVLLRHGADPNVRSKWWAGGFGALDLASPELADLLLSHGAKFDVWSAAAHGRVDVLQTLLDADPNSVNARGGDGKTPLHFATTREVVDLLLARGADPLMRDVDHESTVLQHQLNRPEIARRLLEVGVEPDPFVLVNLDDADRLAEYLDRYAEALAYKVGKPPYITTQSNGGHIYTWEVGGRRTLLLMAAERQKEKTLTLLLSRASLGDRLLVSALQGDTQKVKAILRDTPEVKDQLGIEHSEALSHAAIAGNTEMVALMLEAGFDPRQGFLDGGSALHAACWYGQLEVVKQLVDLIPLDSEDPTHGSPPLGWVLHGANYCRRPGADYAAVAEFLIQKGADVHARSNAQGRTMMEQAGNRADLKALLRQFGAK